MMREKENDQKGYKVWDLPVRLFHWSLVGLVCLSVYTGLTGGLTEMDLHMKSGVAILSLVVFRIVWGTVGGTHARFGDFIKGPGAVAEHIGKELLSGAPSQSIGHNPLGGWMVVFLLALLLFLAGTGLFANDDIFTEGPLAAKVAKATSDRLTTFHHWAGNILFGLVGLHVLAVFGYLLIKKENLIRPMVTGRKPIQQGVSEGRYGSPFLALPIWGGIAGLLAWWLF